MTVLVLLKLPIKAANDVRLSNKTKKSVAGTRVNTRLELNQKVLVPHVPTNVARNIRRKMGEFGVTLLCKSSTTCRP